MTTNQVTATVGPVRSITPVDTSHIAAESLGLDPEPAVIFKVDNNGDITPTDTQNANVGDFICFTANVTCSVYAVQGTTNKTQQLFSLLPGADHVMAAAGSENRFQINNDIILKGGDYTITTQSPTQNGTGRIPGDGWGTPQTGTLHVGSGPGGEDGSGGK
jgi:hypothetical protein